MRITILLALIFTVAFSRATWAAPRPRLGAMRLHDGMEDQTGWKTNSCG